VIDKLQALPLFLIYPFLKISLEPLVTNILTAGGEVGSGTQNASRLHYFSSHVPFATDLDIQASSSLKGIPPGIVESIIYSARTNDGISNESFLSLLEVDIEEKLKDAIEIKVPRLQSSILYSENLRLFLEKDRCPSPGRFFKDRNSASFVSVFVTNEISLWEFFNCCCGCLSTTVQ
jgi:hypothetical protein